MIKLLDLGIERKNKILKDIVCLAEISFINAIDSYNNDNSSTKNSYRYSEKLKIL